MKDMIGSWNETEVTVAVVGQKLQAVTGRAIRIEDSGVLLETKGDCGRVFFPATAILYVKCSGQENKPLSPSDNLGNVVLNPSHAFSGPPQPPAVLRPRRPKGGLG